MRSVICVETGKEYRSESEAARAFYISQSAISNAASGKRATAAGYHWVFGNLAEDFRKFIEMRNAISTSNQSQE